MRLLNLFLLPLIVLSSQYPGIRTSISISSLTSLVQDILPAAISEIPSADIPDISYWVRPLFIPVKMELSDFVVHSVSVDVSKSFLSVNNSTKELYLTLSGVDLFVTAEYGYYIPLKVGGEFNLTLTDSTIIIPISTEVTQEGTVQVNLQKLQGDYSSISVDIDASGPISKMFLIFMKVWPMSKIANHILINSFESLSTQLNPYIQKYMSGYTYTEQLGYSSVSGDYHFYSMNIDPLYIQSDINGTFFINNQLEAQDQVTPPSYLPDFSSAANARIQFTEYFFDTMMWAFYQSDSLQVYIKSQEVPSTFPYTFTTTGLNKLAPGLSTVYGPNLPVDMQCEVYKIPTFDIQNIVTLTAGISCNFLVHVSLDVTENAFTLISTFSTKITANLQVEDQQIYMIGSFDESATQFSNFYIINSNIGNFSPAKFASAFNWYTYYMVDYMNDIFEDQGILVPLPRGIVFSNPSINIYPGAIEVDFDPIFS